MQAPGECDAELVARALALSAGESQQAYGLLVRRHEDQVRSLLRALCKHPAQADDLAQDAFLLGWQKLATLKERSKFAAWIKRLAYRLFLHAYRRSKVEQRYLGHLMADAQQAEAEVQAEGELDQDELDQDLVRLLSYCQPAEAQLLVLVYGFGFTLQEVAQERRQPLGTIKSQMSRAKARIHAAVELESAEESDARC